MYYGDYEVRETSATASGSTTVKQKQEQKTQTKKVLPLVEKKEIKDDKVQGYYVEKHDDTLDTSAKTSENTPKPDDDDKKTKKQNEVKAKETKKTEVKSKEAKSTDKDDEVIQDNELDAYDSDDTNIADHEVDASAKVHKHQSIAKHGDNENSLISTIHETMYNSIQDGDESGKLYLNATQMIKNDEENDPLADVDTDNKVNFYGKFVQENSAYKLDSSIKIDDKSSSQLFNVGASWGKKTDKGAETKVMFFGSFNRNSDKTVTQMQKNALDSETINDISEGNNTENENAENAATASQEGDTATLGEDSFLPQEQKTNSEDFQLYAAASHRFVNKDKLSGSAQFYNDNGTASTLKVSGKYNSNKYDAYVQADVSVYMPQKEVAGPQSRNTVVTNLKVGLNPEVTENQNEYQNIINDKQQQNTNNESKNTDQKATEKIDNNKVVSNKKWTNIKNPYFITETIAGDPSTGLGYEEYCKKKTNNSRLTFGYFAQGEITYGSDKEGNKKQDYNIAGGAGIKYVQRTGKGIFGAKAIIKDKYVIGKGNIFTANGAAAYTNKKIHAEVEAQYINVPNISSVTLDGRVYYNINKNIGTFVDGSYIYRNDGDIIKGGSVQAGIVVNM